LIIFSGANDVMLDEMERSVHDALCVIKRVLEGKKLVVGGGAVETALNVYLENFALNLVSKSILVNYFSYFSQVANNWPLLPLQNHCLLFQKHWLRMRPKMLFRFWQNFGHSIIEAKLTRNSRI
jgi:hypothetical protein